MQPKTYYAAGYSRFSSREDDLKGSNSIANQQKMIQELLKELQLLNPKDTFILIREYSDEDYTGTTFQRPDFQQMLKDCKNGIINCILVKDHSRFARNAAKMQLILEEELSHVRYISKLDHFDSLYDEYDAMFQIKNTFNQMYAEDISKKVHSSIDIKQKNGEFTGSFCCYGYQKSKENKNKLVIDETVRPVVEMIFQLKLQGMNLQAIARHLNDLQIPSPSVYKQLSGLRYRNANIPNPDVKPLWGFSTVRRILTNETYMGNLVQGRVRQKMRKKPIPKEKSEWVIAPNAVPAIISKKTFEDVQKSMPNSAYCHSISREPSLFAGILKCGECQKSMTRHQKNKECLYFTCSTRRRHGKSYCDTPSIRSDILEELILCDLNKLLSLYQDQITPANLAPTADLPVYPDLIQSTMQQQKLLQQQRQRFYLDYHHHLLNKADYLTLKTDLDSKEALLSQKISCLQQIQSMKEQTSRSISQTFLVDHFVKLTPALVRTMIDQIFVYKDYSIKIVYKCSAPNFNVSPSVSSF